MPLSPVTGYDGQVVLEPGQVVVNEVRADGVVVVGLGREHQTSWHRYSYDEAGTMVARMIPLLPPLQMPLKAHTVRTIREALGKALAESTSQSDSRRYEAAMTALRDMVEGGE